MSDYVLRVIAREENVRGLFALTTGLATEGARRHGTRGVSTRALADMLTAGVLMGALLKVRQRVALKFEGNGPLRKGIVEADSFGHVHGYVAEPHLPADLTVAQALGAAGLLTVVKDLRLKELAEGVVHLATSQVDLDIAHYLNQSEQIPSVVSIGSAVTPDEAIEVTGGLLVQSLPPHDRAPIARFTDRLQELPPLVDVLRRDPTPEAIAAQLFAGIPYENLEARPVSFRCQCSRERSRKALVSIGRAELEALLEQEGQAVIDCHFCHEQYIFDRAELEQMIEEMAA